MDNSRILWAGDANYRTVQFEWFLTNWCNFACSYCSEAHNMVTDYTKSSIGGNYRLVLERLRRMDGEFTVELIGGEPTLHNNFAEIVTELNSMANCQKIEVMTNLSRGEKYFNNLVDLGLEKLWVIASYHPQYGSRVNFFNQALINSNRYGVIVNLSDRREYWDGTVEFIEQLDAGGVEYSLNLLSSNAAYTSDYGAEFMRVFGERLAKFKSAEYIEYGYADAVVKYSEIDITRNHLNKFTGYRCRPLRYRIDHKGEILNWCNRRKPEIMLNYRDLSSEWVCQKECCACPALYVFRKEQI